MSYIVRRYFLPWCHDQEEQWLNQMSGRGMQLTRVSFIRYDFEDGEAGQYRYHVRCSKVHQRQFPEETTQEATSAVTYLFARGRWCYFRTARGENVSPLADIQARIHYFQTLIMLIRTLYVLVALVVVYELMLMLLNSGYGTLFSIVLVFDVLVVFILSSLYYQLRNTYQLLCEKAYQN